MSSADRTRWARLVEQQARSGMTMSAFADQAGVSVSSMYRWRHVLGYVEPAPARFVAVEPTRSIPSDYGDLLTVKIGSTISIDLTLEQLVPLVPVLADAAAHHSRS